MAMTPNRALLIQRILAAQHAQRGFQNAHKHGPGANTLLGQFFGAKVHHHYPWNRPGMIRFASVINPAPDFGVIQSMARMNNERIHADRERLLLLEMANQEHSARSTLADHASQQERRMKTNVRAPTKSDHTDFTSRLHQDAAAVREREFAGRTVQRQHRMVHVELDEGSSKHNATAPKGKLSKPKGDTKWLASYEEVLQYKDEFGDCTVPRGFPPNPRLASWVAEQRKQHKLFHVGKNSSITPRRIELLDRIGFAWNAQEAAWERHITDLKAYNDEFGDCLVPLNHPKYPKLGLWVKEQRRHFYFDEASKAFAHD